MEGPASPRPAFFALIFGILPLWDSALLRHCRRRTPVQNGTFRTELV